MKITKYIAKQLANELLEERSKKYRTRYEVLKNRIENAYQEQLPRVIKDAFVEHTSYFNEHAYARARTSKLTVVMRGPGRGNYSTDYTIEGYFERELLLLESEQIAIANLNKRIEAALLALGTKSRVIEQFPELVDKFPTAPAPSTNLPVAIEQLRAELSK